jgi:hypothetical protein
MYNPELISELEYNYDILSNFINDNNKILNIYGSIGCGKTTVVKLYLKNFTYHYISDYNMSDDNFINYISKLTPIDILSYFNNNIKSPIIVIDNYDYFKFKFKDVEKYFKPFKIIIISNKCHFKYNLFIKPPSEEYLYNLRDSINICYDKKYNLVNLSSFSKFFSSLELDKNIVYDLFNEELDELELIFKTKNLELDNYDINNVHISYLNSIESVYKADTCSHIMSDSILMLNTPFYQVMTNMLIYSLDKKIGYLKKLKLNYHTKNKIIKECFNLNTNPIDLSLVKIIKK